MTLTEIFVLIIGHFIADFVLQDVDWANNKSISNKTLLKHTVTYSLFWYLVMVGFSVWGNHFNGPTVEELGWTPWIMLFPIITFFFHTLTDYFTSRVVKKMFERKEYGTHLPNTGAFTVIGLDQVLHYLQLFITYKLLTT